MVTAVKADEINPAAGRIPVLETGAVKPGAEKENETGAAADAVADADASGIFFCGCKLRLLIIGCAPMARAFCSKLIDGVDGGVISSTSDAAGTAASESGIAGAANCSNFASRLTRA